jgi:UPF0716 protein FxsA
VEAGLSSIPADRDRGRPADSLYLASIGPGVAGVAPAYLDEGVLAVAVEVSMVPVLAIAFLVVPVAELAVLIALGEQLGYLTTFAAMVVISLTGAWLARREGLGAWRRLQVALAEGRMPTAEASDGAMILLAGALLLTPGFLSDVVGVLFLLPPVRAMLRRWLPALAARRLLGGRRGDRVRAQWVEGQSRPSGPPGHNGSRTSVTWGPPEVEQPPRPTSPGSG